MSHSGVLAKLHNCTRIKLVKPILHGCRCLQVVGASEALAASATAGTGAFEEEVEKLSRRVEILIPMVEDSSRRDWG